MPLSSGTRLGPYEVLAPLGAGGMGEVYKARDTRLDRIVAIKVLPEHAAARPEVRERFEREARAVSALSHPHICTLYDVGRQEGVDFLVMEYLEGETLAHRLERGPLPMDQVLRYAAEMADALERAHRHKVIHRDLKPANIMLGKDGAKLLDFGLAKLHAAAGGAGEDTRTLALTTEGTVLGTFQYMPPEQLEGKEADTRSDIFAFGAVMYEMVTGRKAFEGKSRASITAAIMERDPPPVSKVQPLAAPLLDKLIKTCLAKDPDQRRQTAHDVLLDLKWISEQREHTAEVERAARPRRAEWMGWIVAAFIAALSAAAVLFMWSQPAVSRQPVRRFSIAAPQGGWLGGNWWWYPAVAISPDASHIAFVATRQGVAQLYLRDAGEWEARPLAGTVDARSPFFSPDGQWLGMVLKDKIVKMAVAGGPPTTIASVPGDVSGATWAPGDSIYFDLQAPHAIMKVPATGGTPQPVTTLEPKRGETNHAYPEALPGGKALLLTVRNGDQPSFDEAEIQVLVLATGERRTLVRGGTNAHYVQTGHLVFARGGNLMSVAFDAAKLEVKGSPVPVLEHVRENPRMGAAQLSIARDGSLIYISGGTSIGDHELVFVDKATGAARALTSKRRPYEDFTLSPDGRMIATTIEGAVTDTWLYDIARDTETRFTVGVEHRDPIWSPDGKLVVYDGYKNGKWGLFVKPADGSGSEEVLLTSQYPVGAIGWTPDRRFFVYNETSPTTSTDIMMIPMEGDRKPRAILQTKFSEEWASISPDGRWLAYTSDETGQIECYVIPFPGNSGGAGRKLKISTDGGERPQWAANGRELYYYAPASSGSSPNATLGQRLKFMAVPVDSKSGFEPGKPHVLFEGPYFQSFHDYAPTPDGKGFVFIRETQAQTGPAELAVVLNWFEELKRLVPVK
jgi:Tol biopolymer transport system component/tRNA A-37 threonylcarbamoyl transferase component Bud32